MESAGIETSCRRLAQAIAAAGGVSVSALGLRFDRVAIRVLDRLGCLLAAHVPEGVTVLLALTAPVRAPEKTVAALAQEIVTLLRTGAVGDVRRLVLHANRAVLRIAARAPGATENLLGFVHNPEVDGAELLAAAAQCMPSRASAD